jgi:peptidoglycan-N-acetylglucosamine deacetylase
MPTATPKPQTTSAASNGGAIALTFDCGYNAASLSRILETLAAHDSHATFFLEGHWVARSPGIVPLIVADGHEIGSHSYSHTTFTTLTETEVTSEITTTEQAIAQAGGPTDLSLFRYPYGAHTADTDAWISARGYTPVDWSIDPRGWKTDTLAEDVTAHIRAHARPGGIVLMHCGSAADESALDQVITDLHSRGYSLVTVSEMRNLR